MSYKSLPTRFSSTELLPLDCDPTTAIWGRSIGFWTCGEGIVSFGGSYCEYCSIPRNTYSNSCEHILQLVDQSNELGVIDTDPVQGMSLGRSVWYLGGLTKGQLARPC